MVHRVVQETNHMPNTNTTTFQRLLTVPQTGLSVLLSQCQCKCQCAAILCAVLTAATEIKSQGCANEFPWLNKSSVVHTQHIVNSWHLQQTEDS